MTHQQPPAAAAVPAVGEYAAGAQPVVLPLRNNAGSAVTGLGASGTAQLHGGER
jgi:hypothetical protein